MVNWFPLGLASGKAFCNRSIEKKHLKYNIEQGIHTLIISPRRYGKTSLARKIITELHLPSSIMEFTLASDLQSVQSIMNASIGQLLMQLMPTHKKVWTLVTKYFSKMNPKLTIDTRFGAKIEFKPDVGLSQYTISELLTAIDLAALEAKKRIILFMDEFQQIATLAEHTLIEAAIRNAAQKMQSTSIIFSGSHRHLLQMMFDDKSRPFYHLSERMNLSRISKEAYVDYIQHASSDRWGKKCTDDAVSHILTCTQYHPYYVNVLCSRLWRNGERPNARMVQLAWENYIKEEHFQIGNEIAKLSHHQKRLLMIIALEPFRQPTSKDVIGRMRASVGSVAKSFKILIQNDYIYLDSDGFYKILDPAIESFLKASLDNVII